MLRYRLAAVLILVSGVVALAESGVPALDPMVAGSDDSAIQLPAWQRAKLRAPETVVRRVELPETRAPEVQGDSQDYGQDREIVGYSSPFDKSLLQEWPWVSRMDGSSVSHVEFISPEACGMRLRLENIDPNSEIEIRLFDGAKSTVLGPFVAPRVDEDGGWWSPTIWDTSIGVELFVKDGLASHARKPEVTDVAHLFAGGACGNTLGGATLSCHNDVVCSPSWDNNEARGVALIYFISGGSCVRCTGALLNREPGDLSPLFMTANHCVSSASEASSVEAYWFYETTTCNGSVAPTPAAQPRNLGAIRLKRHSDSDWTLLGLLDPPVGGTLYLGYRSANWSNNETATGVHHPRGTFKRISFGDTGGTSNRTFCDANGQNCADVDVRRVNYSDGRVEPGSSGSPIFDSDRRVRGTLTGGSNGCVEDDHYYGRLDLAFQNLKYFMDEESIASPVFADGGVDGDPGNNGSLERGTLVFPFNTVEEATFAVRSGDDLYIIDGNYDERMRIWRPMTLRTLSGPVRIGD